MEKTALETFVADPTPANAVALAIADHLSGKLTDWPFVDALRKAQARTDAYPKLVGYLRERARNLGNNSQAYKLLVELGEAP